MSGGSTSGTGITRVDDYAERGGAFAAAGLESG
jgi:hypothetical protein